MTCASCSSTVEKQIQSLDGVVLATVNLLLNEAQVRFDSTKVTDEAIVDAIEAIGFEATLVSSQQETRRSICDETPQYSRLRLATASQENLHSLTNALTQYQGVFNVVVEDPVTPVLLVTHNSALSPQV
eukprot:Blabericola_migrator_1__893@NODE_121_length_13441_cov_57_998280_g108_i0_p7_GENE_NODE_121_length_13441_cov_57_998280_g108_i0NODE_121_length_13441_cov_57_998280_g108_i0_p7_ORF_typecomplete_len129_score20_21HMA/PF00403_26/1_5e15HMA/PF00403_26/2_5e03YscJ_FliF/PF01514_17/0_12YscJ_FliF/PF01514_17/6_1e02DUF3389/PF11869_8/0_21DUF3389/PF11869_8/2_6e03_NODE_121_length_13441_cov_57_998280_g108_i089169302